MASASKPGKTSALGLALALILGIVGSGLATEAINGQMVTTGHTSWADASLDYNQCLAGIAGALLQRVTWFNGQTLFKRMSNGNGDTFMYAMEQIDPDDAEMPEPFDPSRETLYSTGQEFVFTDQNNPDIQWRVKEYFWENRVNEHDDIPGVGVNPNPTKVYVYVVEVAGNKLFDPFVEREYNFVLLVDTCKFISDGEQVGHEGFSGNSPDENENPRFQHEDGEENHTHAEYAVDLFVGGPPNAVPHPNDFAPNVTEAAEGGDGGGSS